MTYNVFFGIYFLMVICMYLILAYGKVSVKQKKILLVVLIIGVSLLIFNKPMEVKDAIAYKEVFDANMKVSELISNYGVGFGNRYKGLDVGFLVYMYMIRAVGVSYRGFTFINSIITLSLFVTGLFNITREMHNYKKVDILKIAILVMIMYGLHYSAIALRGGLSIGLGLCAVAESLKKEKRIWLIVFLLALSMLIHSMGLLNIISVIFCLKNINISRKTSIIILMLMFGWFMLNMGSIVTPFLSKLLLRIITGNGIEGYSTKLTDLDYRVGLRDWLKWIVIFILLYFSNDRDEHQKTLKTVALCGMVILCFGYPFRAIGRAQDYLFVYLIPVIYVNMEEYNNQGIKRLATLLSVLGLFVLQAASVY